MAQFKAFAPNVKVNGQTVLSVINGLQQGQESRREILANNGIKDPQPDQWYPQQSWLSSFEEIANKVGPNTLFMIGKSIPEQAKFPPQIDTLEKALGAVDVAYKMNHQGGDIGYYKLLNFDSKNRIATMECKNPYPSEFDRGILMTMLRKFKPTDTHKYDVVLDLGKPSRLSGADSCTFKISW
ncbi:MAG TPA: hypothetical protein VIT44_09260 [Cyclobacteriaceae bacterium]